MAATPLQQQITGAILPVVAQFNAAGTVTAAAITRQDSVGLWQPISTASPVYVLQEEPSKLAVALGIAQVLRTTWKLYGTTTACAGIQVNDRLAWSAGLTFLVTGLDTTDLAGAVVGTLEKIIIS